MYVAGCLAFSLKLDLKSCDLAKMAVPCSFKVLLIGGRGLLFSPSLPRTGSTLWFNLEDELCIGSKRHALCVFGKILGFFNQRLLVGLHLWL